MDPKKWKDKEAGFNLLAGWGRGRRFFQRYKKNRPKQEPFRKIKGVPKDEIQLFRVGLAGLEVFTPKTEPVNGSAFSSAHAFGARLQKRGYERLGSGCFSTVYAKPDSDKVIKVTNVPDNWIDYIMWASEHGWAGKYAPRVYSYKRYPVTTAHEFFSVAVVERMEKGYYHVDCKEDAYIASALMWPAVRGNTLAQLYLEDFQPGLPKFLLDFHEKFGQDHTDIGGNNIMVRKDGSFCLTDPLAGRTSSKHKRLRSKDFTSLSPAIRKFYETNNFYLR